MTGTRVRAGNAMARSRAAILDAAERCVARDGVAGTTMGEIALTAGVAKATLYNHFRTKDEVLSALVTVRVGELAAECREAGGVAAGLVVAASALASSGALRRVALEPAVAVRLLTPGEGLVWEAVHGHVADVLGHGADRAAGDLVLRWLLGQVLWPASPGEVARAGRVFAASVREGSPVDA